MIMILLNCLIIWLIHIESKESKTIFFTWISKRYLPHPLFVQFVFLMYACFTFVTLKTYLLMVHNCNLLDYSILASHWFCQLQVVISMEKLRVVWSEAWAWMWKLLALPWTSWVAWGTLFNLDISSFHVYKMKMLIVILPIAVKRIK